MTAHPDPKPPRTKLTGEHRTSLTRQARALYDADGSIRGIADTLELSYGLARQLLVEAGVTFRPRGGPHRKL